MRVSSLAVLSIIGIVDASSISGETIQHHMNKMDKLLLVKKSRYVAQGRNLDDSNSSGNGEYGSNQDYGNYNFGSYGSSYQSNGGRYSNGQAQKYEYYTQGVNRNYFDTQNMRQGDFEIDGTHTLKFERCVSLRSLNENIAQYEGKNMQSTSDFVIFKAIDKYKRESEFAIGIGDFVESLIQTIPKDREDYCQVCEQSFESCQQQKQNEEWNTVVRNTGNIGQYYGFDNKQHGNAKSKMNNWGWGSSNSNGRSNYAQDYDAQNANAGGQAGNSNGNQRRKLDQQEEENIEYVDCETCERYGCFAQLYEQQKAYDNSGGSNHNLYSQSGYRNYNTQDDEYQQYGDDYTNGNYVNNGDYRNDGYYQYGVNNYEPEENENGGYRYDRYNNNNNMDIEDENQYWQKYTSPMEAALNWVSEVAECKELKIFDYHGSDNYYTNVSGTMS